MTTYQNTFLSFFRTCKRVDLEEFSKEEMVEIEEIYWRENANNLSNLFQNPRKVSHT